MSDTKMGDRFQAVDDRAQAYYDENEAERRAYRRRIAEELTKKLSDELSEIEERQGIQSALGWDQTIPQEPKPTDRYAFMNDPNYQPMTGNRTVDYWLAHGGHAIAGGIESATGGVVGNVAEGLNFPEAAAYARAAERNFENRYGDLGYYTGSAVEMLGAYPGGQGINAASRNAVAAPGQIYRMMNRGALQSYDRTRDIRRAAHEAMRANARRTREMGGPVENAGVNVKKPFYDPRWAKTDELLNLFPQRLPELPAAPGNTTGRTMQGQRPGPRQNLEPLTDRSLGIRPGQSQSGPRQVSPASKTETTSANSSAAGSRKPPEFELTSPKPPNDEVQGGFDLRWEKGAEKPRQKQGKTGSGTGRPEVTDKELTKRIADTMPPGAKAPPFGEKQRAKVVQDIVAGRDPLESFKDSGIPEKRIRTYVDKVRRIMRTEEGREYVTSAAKAGRPVASLAAVSIAHALTQQPEE